MYRLLSSLLPPVHYDAGPGGPPGGGPGVTPPPGAPPPGSPPAPPPNPPEDGAKRIERIERELQEARQEAARYRTRNDEETQKLRKGMAAALGLEDDGGKPPDGSKILAELQQRDAARETELRKLQVENALERAARTHGADVDLLGPYLRGSGALDKVDPKADLAQALDVLVKDLVEQNPKFKAGANGQPGGQAPPPRGGSEFPGGNQQPNLLRPEDLRRMTPDEIVKARKEGRIAGVGGDRGPARQ